MFKNEHGFSVPVFKVKNPKESVEMEPQFCRRKENKKTLQRNMKKRSARQIVKSLTVDNLPKMSPIQKGLTRKQLKNL